MVSLLIAIGGEWVNSTYYRTPCSKATTPPWLHSSNALLMAGASSASPPRALTGHRFLSPVEGTEGVDEVVDSGAVEVVGSGTGEAIEVADGVATAVVRHHGAP